MNVHKFRVLYFYSSLQIDTGSPRVLIQMIHGLNRSRFQPLFYAAGEGPLTEILAADGVEIVRGRAASVTYRHPVAAISSIRRQIALLRQWKIDLVHVNEFSWNLDLVLAAWIARIPVILHVHNPCDIAFQNLERFGASKVLFCSRSVMRKAAHAGRLGQKAEVFHNTIDTGAFGRGRNIRSELGLGEKDIVIGTVAQIRPEKGIDIVLETARILVAERDDLVFLIVGPEPGDEREFGSRMRAVSQAPAFGGRVRFLGSRRDIPDILASLDLFLLPTHAEAFPVSVIEAMAAGLPVVVSNVGGVPEIVSSPDLGRLIDSLEPAAFAETIRDVLALPDRGRGMGARARLSAGERFSASKGAERLREIYLSVLAVGDEPDARR